MVAAAKPKESEKANVQGHTQMLAKYYSFFQKFLLCGEQRKQARYD